MPHWEEEADHNDYAPGVDRSHQAAYAARHDYGYSGRLPTGEGNRQIKVDKLGLDLPFIQAKRWTTQPWAHRVLIVGS